MLLLNKYKGNRVIFNLKFFIKSLLYRLSASIVIFVISYIFTNNIVTASLISFIEFIVKTLFYYFYEIIWHNIISKVGDK